MKSLRHILYWIIEQWKNWGITAIVASAASAGTWIFARRKEWKESRQAKTEKKLDFEILDILQNRELWGSQRPMTGAGTPLVRSAEIAQYLSLDSDTVSDSLERLEARGRVERSNGTFDNPSPYWYILFR